MTAGEAAKGWQNQSVIGFFHEDRRAQTVRAMAEPGNRMPVSCDPGS